MASIRGFWGRLDANDEHAQPRHGPDRLFAGFASLFCRHCPCRAWGVFPGLPESQDGHVLFLPDFGEGETYRCHGIGHCLDGNVAEQITVQNEERREKRPIIARLWHCLLLKNKDSAFIIMSSFGLTLNPVLPASLRNSNCLPTVAETPC